MKQAPDRLRDSAWLPYAASRAALDGLEHVARGAIALGVTANAVTLSSLAVAAGAGVLLGCGALGWAACAMVVASLGDALDGMVARRTGTASIAGALLDATVDRYEEVFFIGGLAICFRQSPGTLALAVGALAGSFMVSYGSAKAEAIGARVPAGAMRRAERAVCLCAGVAVAAMAAPWVGRGVLPAWVKDAPVQLSLGLVAVIGNLSAVRRLCLIARGGSPRASPAACPERGAVEVAPAVLRTLPRADRSPERA